MTNTFHVTIYCGLREGYTGCQHSIDEVKEFCLDWCCANPICLSIIPTSYVYPNQIEEGCSIHLINYPKFSTEESILIERAIELARLLKEQFKQNNLTIEFPSTSILI